MVIIQASKDKICFPCGPRAQKSCTPSPLHQRQLLYFLTFLKRHKRFRLRVVWLWRIELLCCKRPQTVRPSTGRPRARSIKVFALVNYNRCTKRWLKMFRRRLQNYKCAKLLMNRFFTWNLYLFFLIMKAIFCWAESDILKTWSEKKDEEIPMRSGPIWLSEDWSLVKL